MSVEEYPNNPMLGHREIVGGKVSLCWKIKAGINYGYLFDYSRTEVRFAALHEAWRLCVVDVQRSVQHGD